MNCCFGPKHSEVITIGPGETLLYVCVLHLYEPGPFESSMNLFLDEDGIRKIKLEVRGNILERSDDQTKNR